MKKLVLPVLFAFAMIFTTDATAQKFPGLDKSPLDLAAFPSRGANKAIKVFYSRPQLKGRTVGEELAPYGKLWRTGANDATQIQFLMDMKFGGKTIKKGAYSLFTIPNEKEWTIIISSDVDNWATRGYKESNEVARTTVPATTGDESLEAFSIVFEATDNGATMHLGWDKTRVAVPFTK